MLAEFIGRYNEDTYTDDAFLCIAEMDTGYLLKRTPFETAEGFWIKHAQAFSSDGEILAASGETETGVLVWKWRTQETWRVLPGEEVRLFGVALAPDIRLVAVSLDGRQVWNAETGERLHDNREEPSYRHSPDAPHSVGDRTQVALSPEGTRIATGIGKGIVAVRALETGRTLICQTQAPHVEAPGRSQDNVFVDPSCPLLRTLVFSPDGRTLATGGADHQIRLWEAGTGELLHTLGRPRIVIKALAFAPDGTTLTALSDDGRARTWSLEAAQLARQETFYLPELGWNTSSVWESAARLWSQGHAARVNDMVLPEEAQLVALAPDGSLLACKQENRISIWNRAHRFSYRTLPGEHPYARAVFSADGSFLALLGKGLRLFHMEAMDNTHLIAEDATLCAFAPDGQTLIVEHQAHVLTLWDVLTASRRATLIPAQRGPEGISVLALSPDNRLLATAPSYDETVWLQRLYQQGEAIALVGHVGLTQAIAFSPDGARVATGSEDGTIKIWETSTGTLLATLLALPNEEWVLFTPNDRYSASPNAAPYLRRRAGERLYPLDAYVQQHPLLTI